jgi:hypothetical protein
MSIPSVLKPAQASGKCSLPLLSGPQPSLGNVDSRRATRVDQTRDAVEWLRSEGLDAEELEQRVRHDIPLAVAVRVNMAGARTPEQINTSLAAYFEFHRQSVVGAVRNVAFRFDSRQHLNDHFDGEQLLYLAAPEIHFVTSDRAFDCVTRTAQGPRVHIIAADVLQNSVTATQEIQQVVMGCTPARPGH